MGSQSLLMSDQFQQGAKAKHINPELVAIPSYVRSIPTTIRATDIFGNDKRRNPFLCQVNSNLRCKDCDKLLINN